ncbi:hypothetical protein WMF26_00280 [Sorangium sp. So ce185]|uniref:hypothetical protein n=1 Tax=Sorangium sp. So ce185 TaxID=3133287 RepID=UPI003F60270D
MDEQVTLTGDDFERIDPYEAYISFDIPRRLPEDVVFWMWGCSVDIDDKRANCYVKDYAPLTFCNVERLEIALSLHDLRGEFIRDRDGEIVTLRREWHREPLMGGRKYEFQSECIWPLAICDVSVWCSGSVSLDLRKARLITDATPMDREFPPELRDRVRRNAHFVAECDPGTEHAVAGKLQEAWNAIEEAGRSSAGWRAFPMPSWLSEAIDRAPLQGEEPWTFDKWIRRAIGDERKWTIRCIRAEPNRVVVEVESIGWPFEHRALNALMMAAGARAIHRFPEEPRGS